MRIFSVGHCLWTFLFGWIFGCICIFILLNIQDELQPHLHSSYHHFLFSSTNQQQPQQQQLEDHPSIHFQASEYENSTTSLEDGGGISLRGAKNKKRKRKRKKNVVDIGGVNSFTSMKQHFYAENYIATLKPEELPDFTSSEGETQQENGFVRLPPSPRLTSSSSTSSSASPTTSTSTSLPMTIYLYWPLSDFDFSIHNFQSLESFFSHFPNAAYRFLLLPTREQYQQILSSSSSSSSASFPFMTRISHLLHPANLLQKYEKNLYENEIEFRVYFLYRRRFPSFTRRR